MITSNVNISINDNIFELCRVGNPINIKMWLDNTENNLNQTDEHYFTPLHWACLKNHASIVEMLIKRGAKVAQQNSGGDTCLHVAAQFGHAKIVKLLLNKVKLQECATPGNYTIDPVYKHMQFLSASDIVNMQNLHGNTALHYAAFNNKIDLGICLIEAGAFINIKNNNGQTPLSLAKGEMKVKLSECEKDNRAVNQSTGANGNFQADSNGGLSVTNTTVTGSSTILGGQRPSERLEESGRLDDSLINKTINMSMRLPSTGTSVPGTGTILRLGPIATPHDNIDLKKLEARGKIDSNIIYDLLKYKWNKKDVVVKVLNASSEMLNPETGEISARITRTFAEEYLKLRIFSNPFIIPVWGIVNNPQTIALVYPYMPRGNLYHNIHHSLDETLPVASQELLLKWALDICNGMIFLHSLQEKEQLKGYHLTSSNVFIDEETNTAQINMGDTLFSFQQTSERVKFLEPQYLAPELLEKRSSDLEIEPSQMWSFSVILWEIEHKEIPFYGLSPMEIGLKVAFEGLRLECENDNHVCKLIKICMNDEAGKRPFFSKVAPLLEKLLVSMR